MYLRDGGDRWGVGLRARALAAEYGITYRTPVFPIYKRGHYGGFIGRGFDSWETYRALIRAVRDAGGDFIKIMISGLMDLNRFGVLTEEPLDGQEIRIMIETGPPGGPGGDGPCQRHGCGSGCRSGRSGLCGARGVFASGGLGRDGRRPV